MAEAERMKARAEELYFDLAEQIRKAGVEPNDIPKGWRPAHAAYLKMKSIAKNLEKATTNDELDSLTERFDEIEKQFIEKVAVKAGEEVARVVGPEQNLIEAHEESEGTSGTEIEASNANEPAANTNTPGQAVALVPKNELAAIDEAEESEGIVMLNPVLNKISGLKDKKAKKPKSRKEKKSVSEGGTVYKAHSFDSIDGETFPAIAAPVSAADAEPEPVIIRGAPETRAELKNSLRRSVERLNNDIEAKRKLVDSLKQKAENPELKVKVRGEAVAESVEEQLGAAEDELISLEKERAAAMSASLPEAANENPVSDIATGEDTNVIDLGAKREERKREAEHAQKKQRRGFFTGLMALWAGMSGASATMETSKSTHEEASARMTASSAPAASINMNGPMQSLHQDAVASSDTPKPVKLPFVPHTRTIDPKTAPAIGARHRQVAGDPDRSEEISDIYAKEIDEHGLAPHSDEPGNFASLRAELAAKHRGSAPVAEAVRQSAQTESPEGEVVNAHGLHIEKMSSHIYTDADGNLISFGGTKEQQLASAQDFLKKAENQEKSVFVMSSIPDPETGKPVVGKFAKQPDGSITIEFDAAGIPFGTPTEDDLVKKVI